MLDATRAARQGPAMTTTPGYVHGHAAAVRRSHAHRTAENSAAHLLPHLAPGLDLLDVGCGVGTLTADLAARVAPGRTVGVDAAAGVLADAAAAARERGAAVELAVAEAGALPFADGVFDVVHAHQVLQHLADPVAALREMARVCRPGGLLAVREADYASVHAHPDPPGLRTWGEAYARAARAAGGDPDAGAHLLALARAAGLAERGELVPSASVWLFATPADRAWWGGTWAERTEGEPLAGRLRAAGAGEDDLRAAGAAWREWAAHPDGWMTMTHGELLVRLR